MRAGLRITETFKVKELFEEGYSAEEISDFMLVDVKCIESFAPAKKTKKSAKKSDD